MVTIILLITSLLSFTLREYLDFDIDNRKSNWQGTSVNPRYLFPYSTDKEVNQKQKILIYISNSLLVCSYICLGLLFLGF